MRMYRLKLVCRLLTGPNTRPGDDHLRIRILVFVRCFLSLSLPPPGNSLFMPGRSQRSGGTPPHILT